MSSEIGSAPNTHDGDDAENSRHHDNEEKKENKPSMGLSPMELAKRKLRRTIVWCKGNEQVAIDKQCDPENPKYITHKDMVKASCTLKKHMHVTPLKKSKCCEELGLNLYYKIETYQQTGSYCDRGALYSLLRLTNQQKEAGVITASLGNWAMALAYYGKKLQVKVTVVMPVSVPYATIQKCQDSDAVVINQGQNLAEAKKNAYSLAGSKQLIYLNGNDYPDVIAATGTIALEIMAQLPETDAILVPVGGGALLAGIAEAAKTINSKVLIYGVEPQKASCFYSALDHQFTFETVPDLTVAQSLMVNVAGSNALCTAKRWVNKMVLVEDNWIMKAMLMLAESEKLIVEGAGATSVSPLLCAPPVLTELTGKNVVCVLSGANIDNRLLCLCLESAKKLQGTLIEFTVKLPLGDPIDSTKNKSMLYMVMEEVGVNVLSIEEQGEWHIKPNFKTCNTIVTCETRNLGHTLELRNVLQLLYKNDFIFTQEVQHGPRPLCFCFPKKRVL